MATQLNIGQTLPLSIRYLDQDGRSMPAPTPDAPPAWANSSPGIESLTAAPDGSSASAMGVSAGSDTIQVQLSVDGKPFTATLDVTVNGVSPTQTLTSIEIVPGTPAP